MLWKAVVDRTLIAINVKLLVFACGARSLC